MAIEIDDLLDEGVALQAKGDLKGAEARYRQALTINGAHVDALQLLGSLKLVQNAASDAVPLLEKAVAAAPNVATLKINLSTAYLKTGRLDEAYRLAREVQAAEPRNAAALKQIAACADRMGRPGEVGMALEAMAALKAANVDSELRCARAFLASEDYARAEQAALRARAFGQKSDDVFQILTALAMTRRDWGALIAAARSWVAASPKNPSAHEMLSRAYLEAGDVFSAQDAFKPIFALSGELDAAHALTYGRICLISQDFNEAEACLTRAAKDLPGSSDAAFSLARLYTIQGDLDAAKTACRTAIKRDPSSIRAYVQLTTLFRGDVDSETCASMERIWKEASAPVELLSSLGFALGDVAHRAKQHDEAFSYYAQSNRLNADHYAKEGAVYNPEEMERRIDRIIALSDQLESIPLEEEGNPDPVFVIGMPRSGTTLVESILAAHSKVFGAGEVLMGAKILEDFLNSDDGQTPRAILEAKGTKWRQAYWQSMPEIGDPDKVTDKLPINFLGAGLLAALFPSARFIHTARDPLDTGFSIFRHSFPRAYDWCHRLEDIGHFYRQYQRIIAHFEARLGPRLTRFQYEDLPNDPDRQIRAIVAAAGLEWEPGCTEFHKDRRPVATFSSVQVRSPISKSSIGVSEPYREHLAPLIEALSSS